MLTGLGIVIPNFNLREDTAACVQSLVEAGASLEQVTVVDDGSSDGSLEYLRQRFGPVLDLVALPENGGFVMSSNLGMARALQKGCEWVLLVNNDTLVAPDFLETLLKPPTSTPSTTCSPPDPVSPPAADHLVPGRPPSGGHPDRRQPLPG